MTSTTTLQTPTSLDRPTGRGGGLSDLPATRPDPPAPGPDRSATGAGLSAAGLDPTTARHDRPPAAGEPSERRVPSAARGTTRGRLSARDAARDAARVGADAGGPPRDRRAGAAGPARARQRWSAVVAQGSDAGMATAEYAIAMIAAVGFAGLLVTVLSSATVRGLLTGLVTSALSIG